MPGATVVRGRQPRPWLVVSLGKRGAVLRDLAGGTVKVAYRALAPVLTPRWGRDDGHGGAVGAADEVRAVRGWCPRSRRAGCAARPMCTTCRAPLAEAAAVLGEVTKRLAGFPHLRAVGGPRRRRPADVPAGTRNALQQPSTPRTRRRHGCTAASRRPCRSGMRAAQLSGSKSRSRAAAGGDDVLGGGHAGVTLFRSVTALGMVPLSLPMTGTPNQSYGKPGDGSARRVAVGPARAAGGSSFGTAAVARHDARVIGALVRASVVRVPAGDTGANPSTVRARSLSPSPAGRRAAGGSEAGVRENSGGDQGRRERTTQRRRLRGPSTFTRQSAFYGPGNTRRSVCSADPWTPAGVCAAPSRP